MPALLVYDQRDNIFPSYRRASGFPVAVAVDDVGYEGL